MSFLFENPWLLVVGAVLFILITTIFNGVVGVRAFREMKPKFDKLEKEQKERVEKSKK